MPLQTPQLAYGCMRIAGTWNPAELTPAKRENAHACLRAAYESGYTLFDHADIYAHGLCETLHGELLKDSPELRRQTVIATKCGVRFAGDPEGSVGKYDFSYDHIIRSCEGSLRRLNVETIDVYQLHRPDVLMNPEEVCRAFERLHAEGKVKEFGVSNFTPSYLDLLQKFLPFKLVVNQVEISLTHREPFFDGTLDQCMRESIIPLAWSPLGGGKLGKTPPPAEDDRASCGGGAGEGVRESDLPTDERRLSTAIAEVAEAHNCEPSQVAVAWLLKHPSRIIPIIGTANPDRIRSMVRALEIDMSREQWYALLVAAQGHPMA